MPQDESLRGRLISRLQHLSAEKLTAVDRFVKSLECDSEPCRETSQSALTIQSGGKAPHSKDWPHAPVHRISEHGTFIVTAGTLYKQHHFRGAERVDVLENALLTLAKEFNWDLEAWAVFSNHYHFIGHSRPDSGALNVFLQNLHFTTATTVNQSDGTPGRHVWHNFWETGLTYERSYLARLNYVHQNAVRHGLVAVASHYRWCSAAWFERSATAAQMKTIYSFKIDKVNVFDDFDVVL